MEEADYDTWLDPANDNLDELQSLLMPFDPQRMTARPVSTYVNVARNQGPECVEVRPA